MFHILSKCSLNIYNNNNKNNNDNDNIIIIIIINQVAFKKIL